MSYIILVPNPAVALPRPRPPPPIQLRAVGWDFWPTKYSRPRNFAPSILHPVDRPASTHRPPTSRQNGELTRRRIASTATALHDGCRESMQDASERGNILKRKLLTRGSRHKPGLHQAGQEQRVLQVRKKFNLLWQCGVYADSPAAASRPSTAGEERARPTTMPASA